MKVQYIKKPKINDFENKKYTFLKEYDVIADYRKRCDGQVVADNGLVILNDENENDMIFLNDFKLSDKDVKNTYVFSYK